MMSLPNFDGKGIIFWSDRKPIRVSSFDLNRKIFITFQLRRGYSSIVIILIEIMVGPIGFEPMASRLSAGCSNQAKLRAQLFCYQTRGFNMNVNYSFEKRL